MTQKETGWWFGRLISWRWELRTIGHFGWFDPTKLSLITEKLSSHAHTWNFFAPWLMPRIMTMNGDHQSVAAAPLDLRTSTRERGSTGSKSPDYKGRVRDARVSGGSPAPPACTGTDSLIHCPAVRSAPSSEAGASRKRPADKNALRLPFRKRPIPVEPDTQTQSPAPPERVDCFSLAEDTDCRERLSSRLERAADESRIAVAPVTPRRVEEAGQGPDAHHIRFLHPFSYGKSCRQTCSLLHQQAMGYSLFLCWSLLFNTNLAALGYSKICWDFHKSSHMIIGLS